MVSMAAPAADKIGFVWVRFKQFVVGCSLLVVIAVTGVTFILGVLEIGFVSHNFVRFG
jgi:hypothetical protein